ncbi:hypothetical protein [Streptomyces sp. CNQ085]|uniref:hypothetical protein n=1 Tax=Streptomyces sp. CNQ085 TaxID=2886944 RepID=UPI001F50BAD1|nr:hypothetical protein [Streptomyces sp. CNQ085]MCI0383947.1 hypothetical protein [Streptomyces sp. CNQ085]
MSGRPAAGPPIPLPRPCAPPAESRCATTAGTPHDDRHGHHLQGRPYEFEAVGELTAGVCPGDGLLDFGAQDPYLAVPRDARHRAEVPHSARGLLRHNI